MDKLKKRVAVIAFLAALIVIGSFYGSWQNNVVPESTSGGRQLDGSRPASADLVLVYISGAVNNPGVYKLKPGSRIIDAIKTAGGLSGTAAGDKVNLAQLVKDGMHIHVPEKPSVKPARACVKPVKRVIVSSADTATMNVKISINTADKTELMKLPGIGPTLAGRIITYRKEKGEFQVIDDVMKVVGIGEAKFKKLKDKITI